MEGREKERKGDRGGMEEKSEEEKSKWYNK